MLLFHYSLSICLLTINFVKHKSFIIFPRGISSCENMIGSHSRTNHWMLFHLLFNSTEFDCVFLLDLDWVVRLESRKNWMESKLKSLLQMLMPEMSSPNIIWIIYLYGVLSCVTAALLLFFDISTKEIVIQFV